MMKSVERMKGSGHVGKVRAISASRVDRHCCMFGPRGLPYVTPHFASRRSVFGRVSPALGVFGRGGPGSVLRSAVERLDETSFDSAAGFGGCRLGGRAADGLVVGRNRLRRSSLCRFGGIRRLPSESRLDGLRATRDQPARGRDAFREPRPFPPGTVCLNVAESLSAKNYCTYKNFL